MRQNLSVCVCEMSVVQGCKGSQVMITVYGDFYFHTIIPTF